MGILRFFWITFFIGSFGFFYSGVFAIDCDPAFAGDAAQFLKNCEASQTDHNNISPEQGGDGVTSIKKLVVDISKKVIQFGALFAIGAIVYSGIQYTTSYADDEKVKKAKSTGIFAIIGLLFLLLAFPFVDIVINFIYTITNLG